MTRGEQFVHDLALKRTFHDRQEQRSYLRTREVAKRIVDEPGLLKAGREFLERFTAADPHQRRYYRLWKAILTQAPEEIAAALLEDSDRGAELRVSAPVFVTFSRDELKNIWRA